MDDPHKPKPEIRLAAYACEAIGCAWNLSVGLCAMMFDFGHGMPMERWLPSYSARLLVTGLIYAGSGSLYALTPPGKWSGAHINPTVTLAFYAHGKVRTLDLIGYILGQFIGSIIAALIVFRLCANIVPTINFGMTLPGNGFTAGQAFIAEIVMSGLLVMTIFIFVSRSKLMHWTPLAVWLLVAGEVWLGAPISGTSLNAARSFAPAFVSGHFTFLSIYLIAPALGGLLAVAIHWVFAVERRVLTARLFHSPGYPKMFKGPAPVRNFRQRADFNLG